MTQRSIHSPRSSARHILAEISENTGLPVEVVSSIFITVLDRVRTEVAARGQCTFRGVGCFTVLDAASQKLTFAPSHTKAQTTHLAFAEQGLAQRWRTGRS